MPDEHVEVSKKMVDLAHEYNIPVPAVREIWDKALDVGMPWVCPDCQNLIYIGYEEVVDIGNPLCSKCETEMELADI